MPALPSSLSLTSIADGSAIIASDHRTNYAAVQTAVNALIAALSGGTAGQVLKATSASAVAYGGISTVSTLAGGPPGSPADGDIWVASSVDVNGTRWAFQYNAGSASAFKWEFIGGAPLRDEVDTDETTASTSYVDLTTVGPTIGVTRPGDYDIRYGGSLYNATTTGHVFLSPKRGAAATTDVDSANIQNPTSLNAISVARERVIAGLAAGTPVKLQAKVQSGTGHFSNRFLYMTPIRIS